MINTIETRLKVELTQEDTVSSCVSLWSVFYRKTWKLWNNKKLSENEIHHELMKTKSLTSCQIKSLINKVTTEHSKIKELTKTQLKQKQAKLDNIESFINKENKTIAKNLKEIIKLKSNSKKLDYQKINKLVISNKKKQRTIIQKTIKVNRLIKSINNLKQRIASNTFKLCFGSVNLFKQQPGFQTDKHRISDHQKAYNSKTDWKFDWNLSRNNIWFSVGSKEKPQGNGEMQYYPETKILRLRVTEEEYKKRLDLIAEEVNISFEELNSNSNIKYGIYRMQARFIEIYNVEFCQKNQVKIIQAINNKQPITAKIIKKLTPNKKNKEIGYYLQLSFDEKNIIIENDKKSSVCGIDLNEKGLAYCIVKPDGNKMKNQHGFIQWDLKKKTTEQREHIISNVITKVLTIMQTCSVHQVAIENLDFSNTINNMNSGYKKNQKYNEMLSSFAKTQFKSLLTRKCERLGMTVKLVNPTYSSIGGYAKYGLINKLPVDIAASLWLARQGLYGVQFKKETNVVSIKKHNEAVSLPYQMQSKQSKKLNLIKKEWKEIASDLGTNRKLWYRNTMKFIQSDSVSQLLLQWKSNPFEDPVSLNGKCKLNSSRIQAT